MKQWKSEDLPPSPAPLDFVREHPKMYTRSGHPTAQTLALKLADDALDQGAREVWIRVASPDWTFVYADRDWFSTAPRSRLFTAFVGIPGTNGIRPEVIVTAFSKSVVIVDHQGVE